MLNGNARSFTAERSKRCQTSTRRPLRHQPAQDRAKTARDFGPTFFRTLQVAFSSPRDRVRFEIRIKTHPTKSPAGARICKARARANKERVRGLDGKRPKFKGQRGWRQVPTNARLEGPRCMARSANAVLCIYMHVLLQSPPSIPLSWHARCRQHQGPQARA